VDKKDEKVVEDENVLQTEFTTLFIDDISAIEKIPIPQEFQDKYDAPSEVPMEFQTPGKSYTMYQSSFANENAELHAVLHKLRSAEEGSKLALRIGSYGGLVSEGIELFQIAREFFNTNFTTHLDSGAYSMGAIMFAAGDKRIMYEHTTLMFHNYSGGAFGKGNDMVESIGSSEKIIGGFFQTVMVKPGFFTKEEFQQLQWGRDFYFDTEEAACRGIATHVIVEGVELEADDYIDYLEQGLTIEEYCEYRELLEEEKIVVALDLKPNEDGDYVIEDPEAFMALLEGLDE